MAKKGVIQLIVIVFLLLNTISLVKAEIELRVDTEICVNNINNCSAENKVVNVGDFLIAKVIIENKNKAWICGDSDEGGIYISFSFDNDKKEMQQRTLGYSYSFPVTKEICMAQGVEYIQYIPLQYYNVLPNVSKAGKWELSKIEINQYNFHFYDSLDFNKQYYSSESVKGFSNPISVEVRRPPEQEEKNKSLGFNPKMEGALWQWVLWGGSIIFAVLGLVFSVRLKERTKKRVIIFSVVLLLLGLIGSIRLALLSS